VFGFGFLRMILSLFHLNLLHLCSFSWPILSSPLAVSTHRYLERYGNKSYEGHCIYFCFLVMLNVWIMWFCASLTYVLKGEVLETIQNHAVAVIPCLNAFYILIWEL
jgi:hypothetical protein